MNFDINKLARDTIKDLVPYQSARRLGGKGDIWLNANEYPSPILLVSDQPLNRYPECQPANLIKRYADYTDLRKDQILVSRGADEGIELLIRAFCEPGKDAILICPPTYGMYQFSAISFGIECRIVNMLSSWQINLPSIINNLNKVKIIYICNPNNPTGNIINHNDIKSLLEIVEYKIIVVIDEAYIEFCPELTMIKWINKYPNLVILRTLSKAFALAGLRCGFTLAHKSIINLLLKIIAPYPIAIPIADIANQALSKEGILNMQQRVLELNSNRKWLYNQLERFSFIKTFPSKANYILIKFENSEKIFQNLWNKGIILRDQNSNVGLSGCIRISIGNKDECKKLINTLQEISVIG